jgi:peptidoglycan-associated lipoprotein
VYLGLALTTTVAAGCPGPDWPKCENDDHCKENGDAQMNYVCVFGQCQECGRDADCKEGKKCKANRCAASCKADTECGAGMTCNVKTGDCAKKVAEAPKPKPKGASGASCVEDGDCQSGFVCHEQKCADAASVRNTSEADASCANAATVYFEFNVYDLTPEARSTLDGYAKCLQASPAAKLAIEGHCDERGTTQYNLDLGEKRARAVKEYLTRLGVDGKKVNTVSYGEEKPVANGQSEDAFAKNRRGELKLKN